MDTGPAWSAGSVGFVTGSQGANTNCLAAARHAVLAKAGWDVENDGLIGAPPVRILFSVSRFGRSTDARNSVSVVDDLLAYTLA
jgi:glutamate/tyrosine decarboxylase-like PLP-dependent enzyme